MSDLNELLRKATNLTPDQRRQFIEGMQAAKPDPEVTGKLQKAVEDIAGLPSQYRDVIVDAIKAAGLIPNQDGSQVRAAASDPEAKTFDRIEAAMCDPNRMPSARYAMMELKRAGIKLEDMSLDLRNLDRSMRCLPTQTRMAIKTALARAGLLDC